MQGWFSDTQNGWIVLFLRSFQHKICSEYRLYPSQRGGIQWRVASKSIGLQLDRFLHNIHLLDPKLIWSFAMRLRLQECWPRCRQVNLKFTKFKIDYLLSDDLPWHLIPSSETKLKLSHSFSMNSVALTSSLVILMKSSSLETNPFPSKSIVSKCSKSSMSQQPLVVWIKRKYATVFNNIFALLSTDLEGSTWWIFDWVNLDKFLQCAITRDNEYI